MIIDVEPDKNPNWIDTMFISSGEDVPASGKALKEAYYAFGKAKGKKGNASFLNLGATAVAPLSSRFYKQHTL